MSEFNHLKAVSVEDLEKVIAKAISELIGSKYECSISKIDYGIFEQAKFDVSISMPNGLFDKSKSNNGQEAG
jgi:hypothetical protein